MMYDQASDIKRFGLSLPSVLTQLVEGASATHATHRTSTPAQGVAFRALAAQWGKGNGIVQYSVCAVKQVTGRKCRWDKEKGNTLVEGGASVGAHIVDGHHNAVVAAEQHNLL